MDNTSGGGGRNGLSDRSSDVEGVRYLKCDVPDRDASPDLQAVLEGAVAFLEDCAAQNGAAVIRVHGQSRGASLACAFLMGARGLSAEAAWEDLRAAGIQGLDRSLLWWDALCNLTPGPSSSRKRFLEDVAPPIEGTA